jgi:hypothetical protein
MRSILVAICVVLAVFNAGAQGVLSDIMSGALINPEVGVFAWYELKDVATGKKLFMRQAIVGEKDIEGKTGYYLETEVVPEIGFPIIYKMLLTGPASTVENVHEILVKEGIEPPESLPLDVLKTEEVASSDGERTSSGKEQVPTPAGDIEAEHFTIAQGETKTEVWVNDAIRPMGIVKMVSAEGELVLTRYGKGGTDAESAMDRKPPEEKPTDVTVRVEPSPKRNFSGKPKE